MSTLLLTSKRGYDILEKKGVDVKNMKKDERMRFTLRMPQEIFQSIGSEASLRGIPLNALILQILWEWLERKD